MITSCLEISRLLNARGGVNNEAKDQHFFIHAKQFYGKSRYKKQKCILSHAEKRNDAKSKESKRGRRLRTGRRFRRNMTHLR